MIQQQHQRRFQQGFQNPQPLIPVSGIVETDYRHGAFLRQLSIEMESSSSDPKISPRLLYQWKIRQGCQIEGLAQRRRHGPPEVTQITSIEMMKPEEWITREEFTKRTAISPDERLTLTTSSEDHPMRVIDLLCPVGKGQRALIVASPRSGKTVLMKQFAQAISANYPEIELIVLLIDERPEEVTDMRRTVKGVVFGSSSDSDKYNHTRLSQFVLEYAKRKVEAGKDVVVLLDSLTKLGRTFNMIQQGGGRIMSGGVDSRALEIPKRIFGAARALEGGGSLTIIATALVETNSRMDDLIFQEFKGTGNMEIVLSRDLANERIFPAINIPESGTRREELLFGRDTAKHHALRRLLQKMKPKEAMLKLLETLEQYPTNRKLLAKISNQPEE